MHCRGEWAKRPGVITRQHLLYLPALILALTLGLPPRAEAQEREWILDAAEQDVYLVFGVPETDDVGVSFWCKVGTGRIKIFIPEGSKTLKPETKASFTLTIGTKDYTLAGTTSANDMTGATSVETEVAVDDPMVLALQGADRFVTKVGGHVTTFPFIDSGFANLLRMCKAK
jgi:hypothetical protein